MDTDFTEMINVWIHQGITNFGYNSLRKLSLPIFVHQEEYLSLNSTIYLELNFTVDGNTLQSHFKCFFLQD